MDEANFQWHCFEIRKYCFQKHQSRLEFLACIPKDPDGRKWSKTWRAEVSVIIVWASFYQKTWVTLCDFFWERAHSNSNDWLIYQIFDTDEYFDESLFCEKKAFLRTPCFMRSKLLEFFEGYLREPLHWK